MATCLKEDVRSPVRDHASPAVDAPAESERHQAGLCRDAEPAAVPAPVSGRGRTLREAGFILLAVLGLVLVPSVQSLGLVIESGDVPSAPEGVGQSHLQHGDSVASREVLKLLGRD